VINWTRLINRLVPTGLLPRRRTTEMVLRGLYGKYSGGATLDEAFRQRGIDEKEARVLFDAIDERYGARILSGDNKEMDEAVNAAWGFIAAALQHRKGD